MFAAWERVVGDLVALTDPARDGRARAVLVEARGKVVSGGVDVALFSAIAQDPDAVRRAGALWVRHSLRIAQTLEDLPVPTVFAAHGLTTAAFELRARLRRAARRGAASFGLVEIVVGADAVDGRPSGLAERASRPGPGS